MPAKPTIVLLHGSNGSGATMAPLTQHLRERLDVRPLDLPGHGGRPVPPKVSIGDIAADVIAYLDGHGLAKSYVFGYSSGGTAALYLARHFGSRFAGVCTLAAKYVFDERTVSHWTHLNDPKRLGRPGSKRPQEMTETHRPQDWIAVTTSNQRLFASYRENPPLNDDDLRAISIPALVFSSDNDQIVPLDETLRIGKLIPDCRVVLFRGKCHPFGILPMGPMANAMCDWIEEIERRRTGGAAPLAGAP